MLILLQEEVMNNPSPWIDGAAATAIIASVCTLITTLVLGYWKYKVDKDKKDLEIDKINIAHKEELTSLREELSNCAKEYYDYEIKIDFFNRIMDLSNVSKIKYAVDEIFQRTKADRFLILVAINGKHDFNVVSVIYEQHAHSDSTVSAIGRYHNISIDSHYKEMLKITEQMPVVNLHTDEMPESLLKDFYKMEGVKHSKIRFLARKPIDNDNDFLVYSSCATHEDEAFTREERALISAIYDGQIKFNINEVLQ